MNVYPSLFNLSRREKDIKVFAWSCVNMHVRRIAAYFFINV